MTVKENLIAARALIDTPEKWHKGSMQYNGCFCAMGAIGEALRETGYREWIRQSKEFKMVDRLVPDPFRDLPLYNDYSGTTHADIMALFDRAIAAA